MSQELIYTSASRGLKPGTRGFCTVQCTQSMTQPLSERLESLSGYRHLFAAHDVQARLNPVIFSHLILPVGGRKHHVLSRIADAGLDYTQRSNKFAHHIALDPLELTPSGPAWALSQPGFMQSGWDGEPKLLAIGRRPPPGAAPAAVCRHWQELTGDAGWGGVLAETAVSQPARQVCLLFQPGQALLPLVAEALALVPGARRWEVTFSTWFTKLPPGVECQWRFLLAGSAEAKAAVRQQHALLIDLTASLPLAGGGPWVQAARTGVVPPEAAPARRMASAPAGINVAVDDDLHHAPVLPPQAHQSEYGMAPMMPMLPGQLPLPRPARRRRSKTKIAVIASVSVLTCMLIAMGGYAMLTNGRRLLATSVQPPSSGSTNSPTPKRKPAASGEKVNQSAAAETPPPGRPTAKSAPPEQKAKPASKQLSSDDAGPSSAHQDGGDNSPASRGPVIADAPPIMAKNSNAAPPQMGLVADVKVPLGLQLPGDESRAAEELVKLDAKNSPAYDLEVVGWEKFFDAGQTLKVIRDGSGTNWGLRLDVQYSIGGGRDIGQFSVVKEGLSFNWINADWRLRNCLLKLHADPGSELIYALRKPLLVPETAIDFNQNPDKSMELKLPDRSDFLKPDLLRLQVKVEGLQGATVEPEIAVKIRENVRITIPCALKAPANENRQISINVRLTNMTGKLGLSMEKRGVKTEQSARGLPETRDAPLSVNNVSDWTTEASVNAGKFGKQFAAAEMDLKALGPAPTDPMKDPKKAAREEQTKKRDGFAKDKLRWEQEQQFCSELQTLIAKLKGDIRFTIYYDLGDHQVVLAETSTE